MGTTGTSGSRPHVVVLGAGFAGLAAVEGLAEVPVRVTVVDRHYYNTFQPLLYQVAVGGLNPGDVAYPVRNALRRQQNARFHWGSADGIDLDAHTVHLDDGDELHYDYLVIATGARTNYFGVEGAEENANAIYTLDDALAVRRKIFAHLERSASSEAEEDRLTIVVVGGGATGVEMAGALAELMATALTTTYRDANPGLARVVLVERAGRLLGGFDERLARYAQLELARRGVEVRLSTAVLSSDGERVRLAKPEGPEEDLPCAIVVWAAGVSASAVPFGSAAATTRGGRIEVDANLVLPTHPEVFAAGDVAAAPGEVDGSLLPQLAQPAIQGGRHAAEQIARTIAGESLKPLRYHDKGIMATIGRRAAVCELPPRKPGHDDLLLRGTIAWLTWLGLHVYALIGHRNRASVMMNWAWRYIAWKRGPRVIVGG